MNQQPLQIPDSSHKPKISSSKARRIEVRAAEAEHHLFTYDPVQDVIEMKIRGHVYHIAFWQIKEFIKSTQHPTMRVYETDVNDQLACGHEAGTIKRDGREVCAICLEPARKPL